MLKIYETSLLSSVKVIQATIIRGGSRIPCRRGRQPSRGEPTYDFVKFSEKLHEIKKILGRRGGARRVPPLNPPLIMIM